MAIWDDVLTERDKQVFQKAGFGQRQGLGERPAVLVIDVTYAFVGDRPEPILQSIERYRNSCGEEGWAAIPHIRALLDGARQAGVPVVYTRVADRRTVGDAGRWEGKNSRATEDLDEQRRRGNEIVEEIAPREGELVLAKSKPSAFFGTPLLSYLIDWKVDTLLVAGCTTSGCVRATVVDAFSYNFRVGVVAEACFDRGQTSHKISLFDMNAKYADVISIGEALEYLKNLVPQAALKAGA